LPPGTVAKPAGRRSTAERGAQDCACPITSTWLIWTIPMPITMPPIFLAFIGKHVCGKPYPRFLPVWQPRLCLLGLALANRAGTTYAALLKDEIADPLGLKDTTITLTPEQQLRLIAATTSFTARPRPGYRTHSPAPSASAPRLAICSPTWRQICIRSPEAGRRLSRRGYALCRSSPGPQPQSEFRRDAHRARLAVSRGDGNYWHNGATAAYSSYAFFNPKGDYAAVVLLNTSPA